MNQEQKSLACFQVKKSKQKKTKNKKMPRAFSPATGLHLVQSHQKIRKLKTAFLPAIKQQKNLVYATKIALLAQLIQMKCKKNCQTQTQAPLQKFDQHIRMIRVFC